MRGFPDTAPLGSFKCAISMPEPERVTPQRFYVRASVVEAEQLENGRWLVRGSIFREPTEFSDEDFRASFEQI